MSFDKFIGSKKALLDAFFAKRKRGMSRSGFALGVVFCLFLSTQALWAQSDSVSVDSVRVDSAKVSSSVSIVGQMRNALKPPHVQPVVHGQVDSVEADSTSGGVRKKAAEQITKAKERLGDIFSLGSILAALFVLGGTYVSVRLMTWLIGVGAVRFGQYRLKLMMLIPIVRILMWGAAIYIIISEVFSPSTDKLFAFAASAGLAVGFAAQDVLKNIFGGVLIILDRPFQVGDKIQVGSHYGEVINIGLRTVRIVTPDDSVVSVPNAEIVNQSVSNSNTGALDCQVVIELYLPPEVDLRHAKKLAYEAAATSRFVYLKKPIVVMVQDAYDKGFFTKLKVKAYVLDTRYEFAFASDVSERAKAAFVQAGFYGVLGEKMEKI